MLLKTQLNLTEFELFQFYGSNFIKIIKTGALSREAGAAQAGDFFDFICSTLCSHLNAIPEARPRKKLTGNPGCTGYHRLD